MFFTTLLFILIIATKIIDFDDFTCYVICFSKMIYSDDKRPSENLFRRPFNMCVLIIIMLIDVVIAFADGLTDKANTNKQSTAT